MEEMVVPQMKKELKERKVVLERKKQNGNEHLELTALLDSFNFVVRTGPFTFGE